MPAKHISSRGGWHVSFTFHFPDGRQERVRRKSPVNTKRGAEKFEQQLREQMLSPAPPTKEVPTFQIFSEKLMEHASNNNKYSELCSKKSILKHHLLPAFGGLRLDEIGRAEIESYKTGKKNNGYRQKTINNQLTVLRKTLALAVDDDLITSIPRIEWFRVPEPRFDFFDFGEADRLLLAAKNDQPWQTMILLGMRTGLRQGELLVLGWDDVDLKACVLVVRRRVWRGDIDTPKSNKPRTVPLSNECVRALNAFRHIKGDLVFCHEDGSPYTAGQCKRPLWNICRLAGLRRVGWHVLRHTFCSHLAMRGVPLKVVQEYAGHSDIRITMRYAHLSPEVGRKAVELLDSQAPGGKLAHGWHEQSEQIGTVWN